MTKSKKVVAVILTGGSGTRFKDKNPKQFLSIHGKPLFIHILQRYQKIKSIDEMILVIHKKYRRLYLKYCQKFRCSKLTALVDGGTFRQQSVMNAVKHIQNAEFVVIQNGSSPATDETLIKSCVALARKKGVVSAYIPSFHTVFFKSGNKVKSILNRSDLGYSCDPQVYNFKVLQKALSRIPMASRADIPILELVRKMGKNVYLVPSSSNNIKVTTRKDLYTLADILKKR